MLVLLFIRFYSYLIIRNTSCIIIETIFLKIILVFYSIAQLYTLNSANKNNYHSLYALFAVPIYSKKTKYYSYYHDVKNSLVVLFLNFKYTYTYIYMFN